MSRRMQLAIVASGFSGIAAQIIMLRELMVIFQGGELSISIVLANWLLLEALGCILARRASKSLKHPRKAFIFSQLALAVGLPTGLLLIRLSIGILDLPVGQGLGIDSMVLVSFFALLLVAVAHGAAFTFGNVICGSTSSEVGSTYIYETLGTLIGTIAVTFALIPFFNAFNIASIVFAFSLLASFAAINQTKVQRFSILVWQCFRRKHSTPSTLPIYAVCIMAILTLLGLFGSLPFFQYLHVYSVGRQWSGQNVISHQSSLYGNITVTERAGEYTFFLDGQPSITAPSPDAIRLEEIVHIPMLSHPEPGNVLIISGGAGGKIRELLKHPGLESIDYLELDPKLIETIKAFPSDLTEEELNNPIVKVHTVDGRYFLNRTSQKYDLSFIGISSPTDLQTQRFFTREFYSKIQATMNPGGIIVTTLPSLPRSQLVIPGLAEMHATAYNTLGSVFNYLRVYPGESFTLFLASDSPYFKSATPISMSDKIVRNDIEVELLFESYLNYRTQPWWLENFYASIDDLLPRELNQDFRPIIVFENMIFFSAMFTPWATDILSSIKTQGHWFLLAAFILLLAICSYKRKEKAVPASIFTTGFTGMLLDLALIYSFQVFFGYVFSWIGILIGAFMGGAALGSWLVTCIISRMQKASVNPASENLKYKKLMLSIELSLAVCTLLVPLLLLIGNRLEAAAAPYFIVQFGFILMSCFCGLLVGAQYPIAYKLVQTNKPGAVNQAGLLYGLDLLGGWAGGIIGGLFMIPLLGIFYACLVIALLKLCSALNLRLT